MWIFERSRVMSDLDRKIYSINDAGKMAKYAYNKALDDFRKRINDFLSDGGDCADFVVTDSAIDCVIDELRREVEE